MCWKELAKKSGKQKFCIQCRIKKDKEFRVEKENIRKSKVIERKKKRDFKL